MRDLNLGPDSQKLVDRFKEADAPFVQDVKNLRDIAGLAGEMSRMLERWLEVGWCWPDACPATICGGPHVLVRYHFDSDINPIAEVIEPLSRVGTTFEGADYAIVSRGQEGHIVKRAIPTGSRSSELPATRDIQPDDQP